MYTIITQTETTFIKNPETKTTYIEMSKETKEINEREYFLTVNDATIKYFRRLGGKETVKRSYTNVGYKITKLISISPDKTEKIIREFIFKTVQQ